MLQSASVSRTAVLHRRTITLDVSMHRSFDPAVNDATFTLIGMGGTASGSVESSFISDSLDIGIGLDIGSKFTAFCAYRPSAIDSDWPGLHKITFQAIPLQSEGVNQANSTDDKKEETLIAIPIPDRPGSTPSIEDVYFGDEARRLFNDKLARDNYYFFSDFKQTIQKGSKEREYLSDGEGLEKILVPSLTVKGEEARAFISVYDLVSLCIYHAVKQGARTILERELEEKDVKNIRLCLTVPDGADNEVTHFMLHAAERVKFELAASRVAIPSSQITLMMESIASGVHALYRSCGEASNPLENVGARLRQMNLTGEGSTSLERAALTAFKDQEKHLFKFVHLDVGGGTHDVAIIKCGVQETEKGIRPINKEISANSSFGGNLGGEVIEQAVLCFLLLNVFNGTGLDEEFLTKYPNVRYQLLSQLREMKTAVFKSGYPMYGMTAEADDLAYWAATAPTATSQTGTRISSRHRITHDSLDLSALSLPKEMRRSIRKKEIVNSITRSFNFDKMKVDDLQPLDHQGAVGVGSSSAAATVATLDSIALKSVKGDIQLSVPYRLFFLAAAAQAKVIEQQLEKCIRGMKATKLVPGKSTVRVVCSVYPDVVYMSGSGSLNTLLHNRIKRLCDTLSNELADPANLNGPRQVKFITPKNNSTHCVKGAVHCALQPGFLATSTFVADKSYAVTTTYTKKEVGDEYRNWETQQQRFQEQRTNPWSILHGMRGNHNLEEMFEYITPLVDCQIGNLITVNTKYYIKDFEGKPLIYELSSGVPFVITVCTSNAIFTSVAEKVMLVKGFKEGEVGDTDICTKISKWNMEKLITGRYNYTNETGEKQCAILAFKFYPNKTFRVVVEFVKSSNDRTPTGQTITMVLLSGTISANTATACSTSSSSSGGAAATSRPTSSSSLSYIMAGMITSAVIGKTNVTFATTGGSRSSGKSSRGTSCDDRPRGRQTYIISLTQKLATCIHEELKTPRLNSPYF